MLYRPCLLNRPCLPNGHRLLNGHRRRRAAGLALLLSLTACSGAVAVPEPTPDESGRTVCAQLVAALPDRVLDATRRTAEPGVLTAAWGDPPITLRCGVAAPPGLVPTSECLEVNGVGWFAEEAEGGRLYTTIGRRVFVEVGVPSDYGPQASALVDLAAAVSAQDPLVKPCQ